jgi:hypothetical protein
MKSCHCLQNILQMDRIQRRLTLVDAVLKHPICIFDFWVAFPFRDVWPQSCKFAFVIHAPPVVFFNHVSVNEASRSLSRNSPYFWFLIHVPCYFRLRMLRDGGVIHRLRLNNWPYLGQDEVKSTTVGVDLRAVAPLLVLLSSSVVVSIVVMTLERGKFTFCSSRTQNQTRRERNIFRQRSVLKAAALSKPTRSVFDIRKTQSTAYGFQWMKSQNYPL